MNKFMNNCMCAMLLQIYKEMYSRKISWRAMGYAQLILTTTLTTTYRSSRLYSAFIKR